MIKHYLKVKQTKNKGRGIFTSEDIPGGTIVETSPVIVLTAKEKIAVEKTKLYHYIFEWGTSKKLGALALGYISLYNHNYSSNCDYDMDFDANMMTIRTVKHIKKGEELCVNYNASPNDETKVWFDK